MCGIMGVIGSVQASQQVAAGLTLLQHRGQDAAGILSHDSQGFHFVRGLGLVDGVLNPQSLESLKGSMALGHVRYTTAGKSELTSVQPFLMNYPYGLGMVHNGNLVNHVSLSRKLQAESRRHPLSSSDTEVILNLFSEALSRCEKGRELGVDQVVQAAREVMRQAVGSYSIVTMIAGFGLVAFRDPSGIRPLIHAKRPEAHLFASESAVASFLDYREVQDLPPGEVWVVTLDGTLHREQAVASRPRPCMFEWVYFASAQSELESAPVYQTRIQLGRELARTVGVQIEQGRVKPDIIVPVPETARIAAIALAEELKIPYRELLIKNRYISRTFILGSQSQREKAVQLKLAPVVSELRGKRVMLVDDSIVRGTVSRTLIELVRQAGALEVYFVSTAPPIQNPCYYGIDFPLRSELMAADRTLDQIEQELGADRVIYQTEESLVRAIRTARSSRGDSAGFEPCMACIHGRYPTPIEEAAEMVRARQENRS
ncbi:MAG: amidophosphoribosyltransferase [Pseudomonadota bacterium]|jgi:amidophosphoribosyltransferase